MPLGTDTAVDFTVVDTGDGTTFTAGDFGGTLPTGTITIAAGQTTGAITVSIPNSVFATDGSRNLAIAISSSRGTPIFATSAHTTVTVPPVAGPPPIIQLTPLFTAGTFTRSGNTYTLDLGNIPFTQTLPTLAFVFANAAAPDADEIGGTFSVAPVAGYTVTGATLSSPIAGGQSYNGLTVQVIPEKIGFQATETITFTPTDTNVTGYTAPLAPITLIIDSEVVPPTEAFSTAWGDVHIVTYDGLKYNFQQVGEFTLAKSQLAGDSFDIQLRLAPYSQISTASVIKEVGISLGTDRVTFDVSRPDIVWIDGVASTLSMANQSIKLDGGTLTEVSPSVFHAVWTTGEEITVTKYGTYLNVYDGIPFAERGHVAGLQGEGEGAANDLQLPDGTVLPQPVSLATLYGPYADGRRITQVTSLLDYGSGQTTDTFTDRGFPRAPLQLSDFPTDAVAQAAKVVAAAGITDPTLAADAEFDYLATGGDKTYLPGAQDTQNRGFTGTTPVAIVPPAAPPLAVGVLPLLASQKAQASGPTTVTFDVYVTQASATDTVISYTIASPGPGYLGAAAFGGTLPSGTVTIAAGQLATTVAISLPQGALGSDPTDQLQLQITAPGGQVVAVGSAQTEIDYSGPMAGTPPVAAFSQVGMPTGTITHVGNAYTLDLGKLAVNQLAPVPELSLDNVATFPSDLLGGTFSPPLGDGFVWSGLNLLTPLAAGAGYSGIYAVAATNIVGTHSETVTFTPTDQNNSGYSAKLTPITLTITDQVVTAAVAAINTPTTIVFQNVRVGATTDNQAVSIANTAIAPAAGLDVTPQVNGSATAAGTIVNLAAGATDVTSLTVGLSTATAGAVSGYINLNASSDLGGGVTQPLSSSPVVDVFGAVFRTGAASVTPATAVVHVGDPDVIALTVANIAANDGYSENLTAMLTGVAGGIMLVKGGTTAEIAAGSSDSSALSISISTQQAGVVSGNATLALTSDGGTGAGSIDGLGQLGLPSLTTSITVAVDNYAQAAFEKVSGAGTFTSNGPNYTLDLGTFTQGASASSTLGVLNNVTGLADALSGTFTLSAANALGLSGFGAFNGLTAGQADAGLTVSLDTSATGTFSRTVTLTAAGSNASGYTGPAQTETLTISGTVKAPTMPVLSGPTGITARLGTAVSVGGVSLTLPPGVVDTGQFYTVTLADAFGALSATGASGVLTGNGSTQLSVTGTLTDINAALATLTDLDGQLTPDSIAVSASGPFAGQSAPETILVGHTFTLTKSADTVAGGPGPDVVIATSNTLSAGDTIAGNGGQDTLSLIGAGTFDLRAPATLTGIGQITAQEGQPTYGGFAAQNQIIALRDGIDATVTVLPDAAFNPVNPRAASITIVGAHNAATIQLANGNDTVTLGDARETARGGGGTDTFIVNQSTIGATIDGGTGASALSVTSGGTVAMGSNIIDISTVTLASASTAYAFTANAQRGLFIADANAGADRLTAGAAGQTLSGGAAGQDTFLASSAGGDMFRDTAALFNGDKIGGFAAPGNLIDITDIGLAGLKLGYAQTGANGQLTVTGGGRTTSISLLGSFTAGSFTTMSDGANGVLVGYNA